MSRSPRSARSLRLLAAAAALPLATACLETTAPDTFDLVANPCSFTFAYDTTGMTKTSSGLFYQDLTTGSGATVTAGDQVATYYTVWYTNGTTLDAATPPGQPFFFPAGVGAVIRGYDEGVVGMKVGSCRRIVVPAKLAYGDSTLVFEIGLVGQRD